MHQLQDSPCDIPFCSPVAQTCCVVLYLPRWQTLFELLYRCRSFCLFVSPPHGAVFSLCSSSYIVMSSDVLLSILMLSSTSDQRAQS